MPLKWSPPQRKKLAKGGSKPLLFSNASSLASNTTNTTNPSLATTTTMASTAMKSTINTTTKSTASTLNPQQQEQDNITHIKQQHTSAPLKLVGAKNSHNRSGQTTNESTSSSMLSIYSTNSTNALLTNRNDDDDDDSTSSYGLYHKYSGQQLQHHHQQHQHHNHHHSHYGPSGRGTGGSDSGSNSSRFAGGGSLKRGKKQNWPSRERAGMSFLIVIIFFAVFGVIILMELFMIDDRAHGGMMVVRHANNFGSRSGDSMPDYDNVKDDYDLLDENLLSDNKLGFVQFRDNKLKIQDADGDANGRVAGVLLNSGGVSANPQQQRGGEGAAAGSNGVAGGVPGAGVVRTGGGGGVVGGGSPLIPWGKILPAKVEDTLPHFPSGVQPIDGAWQVVNGTRFKFFVFSAYYDRRDGVKLVRVIGATKTRTPERVWCRFWYPREGRESKQQQQHQPPYVSATVMARVKVIRENWNLKYSAVFVLCPVRAELEVPHYISIVARLRAPPGNLLQLRNTDWDPDFAHLRTPPATANSNHSTQNNATTMWQQQSQPQSHHRQQQQQQYNQRPATFIPLGAQYLPFGLPTDEQIPDKIAVCVKPFHFNYDQALYLMEFLEFYALMGVAHFTFYNHTLGPHATCVLQHYIDGDVPNISTAWDIDLAEAVGKGMTLMGQDAAKVDAVLSGYSSIDNSKNNNKNLNTNSNQNNDNAHQMLQNNNNKASMSANDGNHTKATNSTHSTIQSQSVLLATAFGGVEVTGALQPPPPPPPPQSQSQSQEPQPPQPPPPPSKPPLQEATTLPPVRRYKSEHYAKPTINILPWNLRMRSQKEIRTEGLFAALNDCLYRTMHRYRYLAMVDLDEFIVPRHNDTLNELINSLNHRFRYRNLGAYSFQNAFFYLQFPDDPLVTLAHKQSPAALAEQQQQPYAHTNPVLRAALVTQRKTRRRLKLHPQKQRSKYICKPEAVIEAGNHFVWEFSPSKGSLNVPPTDGILQHYRVCEFGGNDCIKAPSVVDRTATKYVNRLVERVELVYKHLKKPCDLPPLPNEPEEESKSQQQQQQQRKLQSKSTGKLSEERNPKERDNNNNNDNSKGVNSKKSSTTTNTKSDDERIKTLANVKSKRDNDHDTNKGSTKNQATTIEGNGISNVAMQTEQKVKRKQRKVVVFDQDVEGIPIARVEYVDA